MTKVAGGEVKRQQFMVGDEHMSCDWRWPDGHPVWRMSSKEGARWYDDGPLNGAGRQLLLEHFGLESCSDVIRMSLQALAETSPAKLVLMRRELEDGCHFPRKDIRCQRHGGGNFPAEEAA